jgi:hypothetical protein
MVNNRSRYPHSVSARRRVMEIARRRCCAIAGKLGRPAARSGPMFGNGGMSTLRLPSATAGVLVLTGTPRRPRRAPIFERAHRRVEAQGKGMRSAEPRPIRKAPEKARAATATPPTSFSPRRTCALRNTHTSAADPRRSATPRLPRLRAAHVCLRYAVTHGNN